MGAGTLAIGRGRCCAEVGRGGFVEGFRGVEACSGQDRQVADAADPLFRPDSSTAAAWRAGYRAGSLRPDRCFILPMRLGLGLLPAYWYYWRAGDAPSRSTARILGTIVTVISWLGFVVGHLLNNIKGLA